MSSKEVLEKTQLLIGKDVLLVIESERAIKALIHGFHELYGIRTLGYTGFVPENLLHYMNQRNISHAVVHAVRGDDVSVITAFEANKNVVVLRRGLEDGEPEDLLVYEAIERAKVPMISKNPYENKQYGVDLILTTLLQLIEKRKTAV